MAEVFKLQEDFLKAANINEDTVADIVGLGDKLVCEEYKEWEDEDPETEGDLKESIDLMYVLCQYLISTYGRENAEEAFLRVHQNNLAKVQGKIQRRGDGKVEKNMNYKKVDLSDLIPKY